MNDDPLGYVPTPPALSDRLAAAVLLTTPEPGDRILYPGAGKGNIAAAVHRRCSILDVPCPDSVAIERDPDRAASLRERFVGDDAPMNHGIPEVPPASADRHRSYQSEPSSARVDAEFEVRVGDFLLDPPTGTFDYVVMNPPYTAYPNLDEDDRQEYAKRFETATGQYPLYAPFVEQALSLLDKDGVLVFLAPYKWLTLQSLKPLRELVRRNYPCTPVFVPEIAFPDRSVSTCYTTIGKPGGDPWGETRPASSTGLGITHDGGRSLRELLAGLGAGDRLDEAVQEYVERFEHLRPVIWNRNRSEVEADAAGESPPTGRQTSVEQWSTSGG